MASPAETPHELGVIHDIGFRHYTGPRLGRDYLLRSLYGESLKGAYGLGRSAKSKVLPFLLLAVMVLPALIIAVVAGATNADKLPVAYSRYAINLSVVISVYLASQSPASVSRDLRFRVMPLYFSRPLSRNDYVLAKFAAMASALFIVMGTPLLVLYVGALLDKLSFWTQTRGFVGALIGISLLSALLSAIGLLIASITPKRGFGVAAVITVLILLSLVSASLQQVALNRNNDSLSGYFGLISPFGLVDSVQAWVLSEHRPRGTVPPGATGGVVALFVTLAVIATCYSLLILRYRKVSAS